MTQELLRVPLPQRLRTPSGTNRLSTYTRFCQLTLAVQAGPRAGCRAQGGGRGARGPPGYTGLDRAGRSARLTSVSVRSCCLSTSRVSPDTESQERIYGNRNREVVQRRQGLRVHHARRRGQGPVRAPQRNRRQRLQVAPRGREGQLRRRNRAEGPQRGERTSALGDRSSSSSRRPASYGADRRVSLARAAAAS